jgi:pSer/pThr/pTyr-binding forkhead associated (FHA) protein
MGMLELPKDKRFSVAVIQGEGTGQIFQINKTRTMIGRLGAEADIHVDDPECSRQHAVIEILGETAILRDLESTNGTFVDVDRIEQQVLQNQMEFRIGSHVLMFIITDVE